jgi:ribose transport system substrate-binding protein
MRIKPEYDFQASCGFWHRGGAFALMVIALAASISCGRSNPEKSIQIAVVTKALDSEWWQRVKTGAEEAARATPGVRLAVLAPEREINIDQQASILEDQITKRISAIAVAPAGVSEILPLLDKAKAAGIPVIIFDTDVDWPSKLSFVGSDNREAGRLAGGHIVKVLGGKGKVAVIRGILGIRTHDDRLAGFREAVVSAPGIEIVTVQPANSERGLGMSVTENILTTHPALSAIFATNDQMALGAVEAIAARNITGKVVVVGVDATREAVTAIQNGKLSADISMHPEALGRGAVEAAIKAARGEPVEKRIDTGATLVTRENAGGYLR